MNQTITPHASYTDAALDLAAQISARYGGHPGVMDLLAVTCIRTPHAGSDRTGFTLIALPRDGGRERDEVLVAYFGEAPAAQPQLTGGR
jgi:hypothetical protein